MGEVKAPMSPVADPLGGPAIEAQRNIRANGVIVQHPRTMNPIENPYLGRRDKARAGLLAMRGIRADWLWKALLEEA